MWSSSSAAAAARCGRWAVTSAVSNFQKLQPKGSASGSASASLCGAALVTAIGGAASSASAAERGRLSHAIASRAYNTSCAYTMSSSVPSRLAGPSAAGGARFKSTSAAGSASANATAGANTTSPAAAAKTKQGFVAWYESHLQSSPVRTKMVTGSILWGLGDVVAQLVPHFVFDDKDTDKKETEKDTDNTVAMAKSSASPFVYDYARTGRAAFFGFAIHAPLSHVHYNFLEYMTVTAGFQGLAVPVFKTVMEQFVYWSWFSNSLYHGAMGAMQGWTWQQCYDRIADVLWDTQKAQWVFWIPVQLLNFNFVPVRHQLNVVLLTSVVWTALLSAWYPPAAEEDEAKGSDDSNNRKAES